MICRSGGGASSGSRWSSGWATLPRLSRVSFACTTSAETERWRCQRRRLETFVSPATSASTKAESSATTFSKPSPPRLVARRETRLGCRLPGRTSADSSNN
ncbi:unnamed protein product [Pylaiella littoralis]